jgi:hypothetical protein
MLEKLAQIANELDNQGLYKEAEAVTSVMKRVSHWWSRKQDGPIRDFSSESGGYVTPDFLSEMIDGEPIEDNRKMLQMHSVLKNYGIDTNGLSDDAVSKIYDAIMISQQMQAFAENKSNTKLGS